MQAPAAVCDPAGEEKEKLVARGNKLFSEKMLYIIRKALTLQGRGDEQAGTGQRKTL